MLSVFHSILLRMSMFQTKVVEKIKTHFCSVTFFENHAICEIIWKKHSTAGEATDESTGRAYFKLAS